MPDTEFVLKLSKNDLIFIYGYFQKQLASIDKFTSTPECPFDSETIKSQRAPFLSVIDKIRSQYPKLEAMDKYF